MLNDDSSNKNEENYYFNRKPLSVYLFILPPLILFIITIIFIFLINIYRKNSFVYVRTILLSLVFITSMLSLTFYTGIIYNKKINKNNKYIAKINVIISSIILGSSILYLLLSHTFGCF